MRFAPGVFLLLLTAGFYWKLALPGRSVWFNHPDTAYLELPRLAFEAREIHAGRFPLWDPHIWAGQPLLGQTQPGPLYPLNLLLCLLPLENGHLRFDVLNWYFLAAHFLAALFCYWLARDLGLSMIASLAAASIFSFGGFLGSVPWPDVMNGGLTTPLVFLFLFRAARGERRRGAANAALSGLALGVAWLSGHHEVPLLVSLAAAGTWLYFRKVRLGLLAMFVAMLIAAAQMAPTIEFGRLSKRWVGIGEAVGWNDPVPYLADAIYSMPVRSILDTVLPAPPHHADTTPFTGLVAALLAVLAVVAAWSRKPVRWLTVLLALSFVWALGAATPLQGFLYSLPGPIGKARVPVRAFHLFDFAIAMLAAYGIDVLTPKSRWKQIVQAALFAVILFELSSVVHLGFAPLAQAGFVAPLRAHDDIARYLRAQPQPVRAAVNDHDIPANFGDWYGIDMHEGYVAGLPLNLLGFAMHSARSQALVGVTHVVARAPERPDQPEVFAGASGVKVFHNTGTLLRVRIAHDGLAGVETCDASESAEERVRTPNRLAIVARAACRGLLVVGDTYYPGWRARIDGRPAEIREVYGALRGVVVERGEHVVEMVYRPASVYGGASLAAVGLLLTAALVWRRR